MGATPADGGTRDRRLVIGGAKGLAFHAFEAEQPHPPIIIMEVLDDPSDLPPVVRKAIGPHADDPAGWAKACQMEWGADACCLKLVSANPEGKDRPVEACVEAFEAVRKSISLPLFVYGCGQEAKDAKLMEAVSNAGAGERLALGLAGEEGYKSIAAASMANGHAVVGFSNLDVNLAKQMVILLTDFGVHPQNLLLDPLQAALGMGLEYTYSVIERLRLGALQGDPMLQVPLVCDCTCAWTAREAFEENPALGETEARGVLWETLTALSAILAGADAVIVRHPSAVTRLREAIADLRREGG